MHDIIIETGLVLVTFYIILGLGIVHYFILNQRLPAPMDTNDLKDTIKLGLISIPILIVGIITTIIGTVMFVILFILAVLLSPLFIVFDIVMDISIRYMR